MHVVDWLIMIVPMAVVAGIAIYTRRYVKSVADFMAGGRLAGRYILCVSRDEIVAGAVCFVAMFEQFSESGFTLDWWGSLGVPVGLMLAITGFVIYRYRQTRALTLAQFLEMRYSRKFRIFAGILGFLAGLVNFGVIPAVGARFFVSFLDLPQAVPIFSLHVPTFWILMACFLGTSTLLTTTGGQVTNLIVCCAEGMFSQVFYVIIAIVLLCLITWPQMHNVLMAQPAGHSMVNPFDTSAVPNFNVWFVLMGFATRIYGTMAWQNSAAFNSSAATPHDSRMGGILARWRGFTITVLITIMAVCALTVLQSSDFAAAAARTHSIAGEISDAKVATQMTWPIALAQVLPVGIKGLICCVILMGVISGDGMAMHSWGTIFIQDVVMPLRKKPLTTRQHMALLRLGIILVAVSAFLFGSFFTNMGALKMWWAVTTAIFVGGAGAAILGGLYWSRGTTAAAWAGMLTGSLLSFGGILVVQEIDNVQIWNILYSSWLPAIGLGSFGAALGHTWRVFPLNGMEIAFYASFIAMAVYIGVSFLTCRQPHNMDQLLHRGQYAVEAEDPSAPTQKPKRLPLLYRIFGIDEHFTRSDRWVTLSLAAWSFFWFGVFVIGSIVYLFVEKNWSHEQWDEAWAQYWRVVDIWLPLGIGAVTTVWFTIGGFYDMRMFFRRLRTQRIDEHDDGSVTHSDTDDQPAKPK